jgi:hypothetical protein
MRPWKTNPKRILETIPGLPFSYAPMTTAATRQTTMNHTFASALAGLLIAGSASAASIDLSKLPPPSSQQGVTYAKDIRPLFQASCIRCHGGERAKAGLHLDTLEGVLNGSKDGKVVVVGNSVKSPLVLAISRLDPKIAMPPKPRPPKGPNPFNSAQMPPDGNTNAAASGSPGRMPPPPKPLTPERVGLVRAWIDQGAN